MARESNIADRDRTGDLAARILAALAFVAPIVSVYGARGSVILIAVSSLFALIADIREKRCVPRPPILPSVLTAALVGWMALSAIWAVDPADALHTAAKVGGIMIAGMILLTVAARTDEVQRRNIRSALGTGIAIAMVLLAGEIMADGWLIRLFRNDVGMPGIDVLEDFNNSGAQFALWVWLAVPAIPAQWRKVGQWAAIAGTLVLLGSLEVATYVVAVAVGAFCMVAIARKPRVVILAIGSVIVVGFLLVPQIPKWLPAPQTLMAQELRPPRSLIHRVAIWQFAAERIAERPWLGWGAHASRHIGIRHSAELPESVREMARPFGSDAEQLAFFEVNILPLHPHDGMIQAWLELGVLGAVLGAALAVIALFAVLRHGGSAAYGALVVTAMVIFGMSFGVWQSWWLATLWMMTALAAGTRESG